MDFHHIELPATDIRKESADGDVVISDLIGHVRNSLRENLSTTLRMFVMTYARSLEFPSQRD